MKKTIIGIVIIAIVVASVFYTKNKSSTESTEPYDFYSSWEYEITMDTISWLVSQSVKSEGISLDTGFFGAIAWVTVENWENTRFVWKNSDGDRINIFVKSIFSWRDISLDTIIIETSGLGDKAEDRAKLQKLEWIYKVLLGKDDKSRIPELVYGP